jgi:ribosomal protein S18 acetylase RimI-like enzyme
VTLPQGYTISQGSSLDRAQLLKFMRRTYQELYPTQPFHHLAQTVEQYLSPDTPLWWVRQARDTPQPDRSSPVGCLWLGSAVDQVTGDRHAYIFLLYVDPLHRRQGIGTTLIHQAEAWATERGDRQIGLQVFSHNQPALHLYEKLGYKTQAIWMAKHL